VSLIGRQKDMRRVYGNCKILLVPSIWEEGYGMVATEAQSCGIPVVGSARGGLPEAIGPGGLLIDPDGPIEAWAEAVRRLWADNRLYAALSAAAGEHARRLEMTPAYQIDAYEQIFRSVARGSFRAPLAQPPDAAGPGPRGHLQRETIEP
jgi:glycosyltransferase involved in cell wall biosynthesis